MSISILFQNEPFLHDFFNKLLPCNEKKLVKYLVFIAIDYLSKYYKNKPFGFENVRDLAKMIKSKHRREELKPKLDTTLNNELQEIQTELTKLKSLCSNKERSSSLDTNKGKSNKKSLTIEELGNSSVKKSVLKPREVTPKITEAKAPRLALSKSVSKPPLTKHHLDDHEIKASLIEMSSNYFSSMVPERDTGKAEFPQRNVSSAKNSDSVNRRLFASSRDQNPEVQIPEVQNQETPKEYFKSSMKNSQKPSKSIKPKRKPSKFAEIDKKSKPLPNYLKNVQSRIKEEIEFHKRMFRDSQRSPNFQIKEQLLDDNDKEIINEFITFGSASGDPRQSIERGGNDLRRGFGRALKGNSSESGASKTNIIEKQFDLRNSEAFSQEIASNDNIGKENIVEIANSFLKSPFMHFIEEKNKLEDNSNFQYCNNEGDSSRISKVFKKYSPYNESGLISSIRDPKKESSRFSNIKIEQMSEVDSNSSTFSMLPFNEELQGVFKREYCLAGNSNREARGNANTVRQNPSNTTNPNQQNPSNNANPNNHAIKRESEIGKIVSLRRDKPQN